MPATKPDASACGLLSDLNKVAFKRIIVMEIEHYLTDLGIDVFQEWFLLLSDKIAKANIRRRLERIKDGNLGQVRYLHDGVWEIKVDVGAGYRVYYAQAGQALILLLCGGNKRSQKADITRAVAYWENYQLRKEGDTDVNPTLTP